jgi:hypothetical protein
MEEKKPCIVFNQLFTAKSKKTGEPFYCVKLFDRREAQDKSVYFRDVQLFVDKPVFEKLSKQNFHFGDIVAIETAPPLYIGGAEQLIGLKLIVESPYFDL